MYLDPRSAADKNIIFALIFMLANRLQTIGDSYFKEITTKQWFVLLVLEIMQPYSPTLTELAEGVGSSHQNVKQLVLKLEQKGFVELFKDEEDARRLRIKATLKSREFNQAYHEKNLLFIKQLFEGFDDEELKITKNVLFRMKELLERMENEYVRG